MRRREVVLEEYTATFDDDDIKFVGTLVQTGLFTPNVDGPNEPHGNRNNIGDVWVVATYGGGGSARARTRAPARDGAALHGFDSSGSR